MALKKKQFPDHKRVKVVGNTGKSTLWFDKKRENQSVDVQHFFEILDQNWQIPSGQWVENDLIERDTE